MLDRKPTQCQVLKLRTFVCEFVQQVWRDQVGRQLTVSKVHETDTDQMDEKLVVCHRKIVWFLVLKMG